MKHVLAAKVLLGKHGEEETNSALKVVDALGTALLDDIHITPLLLTPNYGDTKNHLRNLTLDILDNQPVALIVFGCCWHPSVNMADIAIQHHLFDQDHVTGLSDDHPPVPVPCPSLRPLPYTATIPVDKMAKALRSEGIPTSVKAIATRCSCAASAFLAASVIHTHGFPVNLGLIHLPPTSESIAAGGDVSVPSLPYKTLFTAAEIICRNA